MELWELVARERIRDTLAFYNWSGDAFRLSDLASAFAPDGILEIRGQEPLQGREAIIAYLSGSLGSDAEATDDAARRRALQDAAASSGVKRIVRHNLTNLRFLDLTPDGARVASYFTVVTEIGLDHYGRYRDTFVPVSNGGGDDHGDGWLIQHRLVSTDWRAADSTMASPASIA